MRGSALYQNMCDSFTVFPYLYDMAFISCEELDSLAGFEAGVWLSEIYAGLYLAVLNYVSPEVTTN